MLGLGSSHFRVFRSFFPTLTTAQLRGFTVLGGLKKGVRFAGSIYQKAPLQAEGLFKRASTARIILLLCLGPGHLYPPWPLCD